MNASQEYKKCKTCNEDRPIDNFRLRKSGKYDSICIICINKNRKIYRINNKDKIKKQKRQSNIKNKDKIKIRSKKYQEEHKDEIKISRASYRENNKDKIKQSKQNYYYANQEDCIKKSSEYHLNRLKTDATYRLKCRISNAISKLIKKNGDSVCKYLPYEVQELKQYIGLLFEPWMTWENRGVYDPKTWDDNDSSTWTWQLDHIVPQSDLPYDSMEHPNFQKCWALENLRPYSAKQNILDGVKKTRHTK